MNQSRHKRTNGVWFHLCKEPRIGKFIETESRITGAEQDGVGSEGDEELLFNGCGISVWKDKNF